MKVSHPVHRNVEMNTAKGKVKLDERGFAEVSDEMGAHLLERGFTKVEEKAAPVAVKPVEAPKPFQPEPKPVEAPKAASVTVFPTPAKPVVTAPKFESKKPVAKKTKK